MCMKIGGNMKKIKIVIAFIFVILIGYIIYVILNKNTIENNVEIVESIEIYEDKVDQEENLTEYIAVQYFIDDSWKNGDKISSKYTVSLINNSNNDIEDWKVEFKNSDEISIVQIWNAKYKDGIASPEEYNKILNKNSKIEFGFILESSIESPITNMQLILNKQIINSKIDNEKIEKKEENMNNIFFSKFFAKTPVAAHGRLKVKDGKIVDKNNKPYVNKGISTHNKTIFSEYV